MQQSQYGGKEKQKSNRWGYHKVLGVPRLERTIRDNDVAGVVTGLAWTSVGGDILLSNLWFLRVKEHWQLQEI
jgi:ATP-dependent Lon protease